MQNLEIPISKLVYHSVGHVITAQIIMTLRTFDRHELTVQYLSSLFSVKVLL